METKNIINIPEGFEIDKEQSTERRIVLKKIEDKKVRTWDEYCEKMKGKSSYYYDGLFEKVKSSKFGNSPMLPEFEDKEDVETLVAFCKLIHLRRDWVKEWEPDYENVCEPKFAILTVENKISKEGENYTVNSSMSFPTEKMRDEFFDCFKDLLEQAKLLL